MIFLFVLFAASYQNIECTCSNLVERERIARSFVCLCGKILLNRTMESLGLFGTIEITDSALIISNLIFFSIGKIAYKQATEGSVWLISTRRLDYERFF